LKPEHDLLTRSVRPIPDGPVIDATNGSLKTVTAQAISALRRRNDPPELFYYGGKPHRIETRAGGPLTLKPFTVDILSYELARAASWVAGADETYPPLRVVRDVLASPDLHLPVLSRIVDAPVFGQNGEVQTVPGYHAASGTYYHPADGFELPSVPDQPTVADVERAKDLLLADLLHDFPFVSQSDRAHVTALILLPFARDLISGPTPLHSIEKPTPGTGAGLLVDVISLVSTGRPACSMSAARDEEEWRKRLTAALRTNAGMIVIDNIRYRLHAAALAHALTAEVYQDRILRTSDTVEIPIRCAWVSTANNPTFSAEIARRTVRIRLDARVEQPWLRTQFKHADLKGWAAAHRSELVWAALTLIQVWIAAERPEPSHGRTLGSYSSWAAVMGGVLQVVGIEGFLQDLGDFYSQSETETPEAQAFVELWWDRHRRDEVTVQNELFQLVVENPGVLDLGNGNEISRRTALGRQVSSWRDRRFTTNGGCVRVVDGGMDHHARKWKLEPVPNHGNGASGDAPGESAKCGKTLPKLPNLPARNEVPGNERELIMLDGPTCARGTDTPGGTRTPKDIAWGESETEILRKVQKGQGFLRDFDWTMQLQIGCPAGCRFCYMQTAFWLTRKQREQWGTWVNRKADPVRELQRRLRKGELVNQTIYWSGTTDDYTLPPPATREVWQTLYAAPAELRPRRIVVQTRFNPARDRVLMADYCRSTFPSDGGPPVVVSYSIGTDRDDLIQAWEERTPLFGQRLKTVRHLRDAGLFIVPTLSPFLLWDDLRGTLQQFRDWGIGYITMLFIKESTPSANTPKEFLELVRSDYPALLDPAWQQDRVREAREVYGEERVLVGQAGFASLAAPHQVVSP
jgi:DNA repair photolyase